LATGPIGFSAAERRRGRPPSRLSRARSGERVLALTVVGVLLL